MKRVLTISLILLLLAGGGYFAWKLYFSKHETVEALALVPSDAVFIVETDEPVSSWKTFAGSDMWNHVKRFTPLGDVGKMADALSRTIEENDAIFSAFGQRAVLISAHVVKPDDYDFLYVCDMQKSARFDFVRDGIISLLKNSGYRHSETKSGEQAVHHFFDAGDKSTLHLSFVANQLVCSFNENILNSSLEQRNQPVLAADRHFIDVSGKTAGGGLCKIYLNHRMVPRYLDVYMDDVSGLQGLFGSMHYTGASANMDGNLFKFQGLTNLNDSMSSHLRALALSGKAKTGAQSVLSERAAFVLSMGFSDFKTFYGNLTEVMKQDKEEWQSFEKNKRTVEKLLGFSMEEDLLGWIGDEVTVAQYQQDRVIGGKVHTVVAMRASGIEKAREKLEEIEKRIRRRTPMKFKSADYKDHDIHYLEIKGLFKLLFGKLFGKIEKPYYTYMGDYVVFCDDIATLLNTIDDEAAGKTLAKRDDFNSFYEEYHDENSLFVYLNMPRYFLDMKGILSADNWRSAYDNREFIVCFDQLGFQFTEEDGRLNTRLLTEFRKPDANTMEIAESKPLSIEQLEDLDSLSDADAFILEHITGSVKKELYDDGKVKFMAEMKDDVLHGRYIEYWENGNIKVKGKYRDGEKTGKWRYFNEDGELEKKEKFGRRKEEPDQEP